MFTTIIIKSKYNDENGTKLNTNKTKRTIQRKTMFIYFVFRPHKVLIRSTLYIDFVSRFQKHFIIKLDVLSTIIIQLYCFHVTKFK